jgi:hypothetical protein
MPPGRIEIESLTLSRETLLRIATTVSRLVAGVSRFTPDIHIGNQFRGKAKQINVVSRPVDELLATFPGIGRGCLHLLYFLPGGYP